MRNFYPAFRWIPVFWGVLFSLNAQVPAEKNGKWGYVDSSGQALIDYQYNFALPFSEGLAAVRSENRRRWGYINHSGHIVIGFQYYLAGEFYNSYAIVAKYKKGDLLYGLINRKGKEVMPLQYRFMQWSTHNLIWADKSDNGFVSKYQCFTDSGTLAFKGTYHSHGHFYNGLCPVQNREELFGYIDLNGQLKIAYQYEEAGDFKEGYAVVMKDGKRFLIDSTGKEYNEMTYHEVREFKEGLARVRIGKKYGFINRENVLVIPLVYDLAWFFSEGLAPVKKNGKWGYINKNNETVIPFEYEEAFLFRNGIAQVKKFKYGIIDSNNNVLIDFKYHNLDDQFLHGMLIAELNGKKGALDRNGKVVIPFKYYEVKPYKRNWAKVRYHHYWGKVDTEGNEYFEEPPIPPRKEIRRFAHGLNIVEYNGMEGLTDKQGREITPIKYFRISDLSDLSGESNPKRFSVRLDGLFGMIDQRGKELTPIKYHRINRFFGNTATVLIDDKIGLINARGEELIPLGKYERIIALYQEKMAVPIEGKWAVIDTSDNVLIPPLYDQIGYQYLFDRKSRLLKVKLAGKYGLLSYEGDTIVPLLYDKILDYIPSPHLFQVEKEGLFGFVDFHGQELIKGKNEYYLGVEETDDFESLSQKHSFVRECGQNKKIGQAEAIELAKKAGLMKVDERHDAEFDLSAVQLNYQEHCAWQITARANTYSDLGKCPGQLYDFVISHRVVIDSQSGEILDKEFKEDCIRVYGP